MVINSNGTGGAEAVAALSSHELEVMRMTALGLTNREIAGRLSVTVHCVKYHLASIFRKLGVANRTEAAVVFLSAASSPERKGGP